MEHEIWYKYPQAVCHLANDVFFIDSQELEDMYPDLSPKEREDAITKEKKCVFIKRIGHALKHSGKPHDGRAPDYDDWNLNGDLFFWLPSLERALEISSMGIRVDENSIVEQCHIRNAEERLQYPYHQMIQKCELPYTIGGGIGQSRLCMLLPVSYTHLDVYKRQTYTFTTQKISKVKELHKCSSFHFIFNMCPTFFM